MDDLLNTLSHTPLPTILMVAGIFFWILAIAGSLAGKITVEPAKQKTAAVVGTTFVALGLFLIFFTPESEPTRTTPPSTPPPTPSATQPTPPPAQPTPPRHTRPSPGVDCTSGTPDEREICGNASDLDWQLYDIYQSLMGRLEKDQKTQLMRDESAWVRQRANATTVALLLHTIRESCNCKEFSDLEREFVPPLISGATPSTGSFHQP